MGNFNLFVHLNAYKDATPNNNPSLNNFKWSRDIQGIAQSKANSDEISIAPGESKSIFNGLRTLTQDNTTEYSLALKSGTTNTYQLKHISGAAPGFRTSRTEGADATTVVTVTQNGTVLKFESTAGTALNLIVGGVVVGDYVLIGDQFSTVNRGLFKIIALTATSFSVEHNGVAEATVTLGATFADQIRIFSAAGVQIKDKIRIFGGLSPVSWDTYEITGVQDNLVEFYSTKTLPTETVVFDDIAIYSSAKKLVYVETDKKLDITVNETAEASIEPFEEASGIKPGIMLRCASIWSLMLTNNGTDAASVYVASIE